MTTGVKDQVGDPKDHRPWRKWSMDLPDDKANMLEDAINLAIHYQVASNRVEAIEAITQNFMIEYGLGPAVWLHCAELNERTYALNSLMATRNAGYRCGICETSKNLTVHHIYPRGWKGDRPDWVKADINHVDNLVPLCLPCHEVVQPKWRDYVMQFALIKEERAEQMRNHGYIETRKHATKIAGKKWT